MISEINTIRHFTSKDSGAIYGIYDVSFNGNREILIRNGNSVGAVRFYLNEPVSKCVSEIRDDVKVEFLQRLDSIA